MGIDAAHQSGAFDDWVHNGNRRGITIAVPVLLPLVAHYGIDPVHFGLIVVLNLVLGLLTPPVGLVLFVTSKIADISAGRMFRAVARFYLPLIVVLLLITYLPGLVTFLLIF